MRWKPAEGHQTLFCAPSICSLQVKVETEALAKWRFAMFSGKFATR